MRLYLILQSGERVPLAQAGPDSIDLREPRAVPAGPAIVEARIDEGVERWDVVITAADGRRIPIRVA